MSFDPLTYVLDESRRLAQAKSTSDWPAKVERVYEQLHPAQLHFALDPSKRIAALVGRGGGKTTGVRARFVRRLLLTNRARCLFFASTRQMAEELLWNPIKHILGEIGFQRDVDVRFHESKLKLTITRTGSTLQLAGIDNRREIEKYRGQPFHEVWIDEGSSYPTQLLEHLIYRVIGPRLGDYKVDGTDGGILGLTGTPGHILSGPFYEHTRVGSETSRHWNDREPGDGWDGYSLHTWTQKDGADAGIEAMRRLWDEALREKQRNGWSDDHPVWRREYLGQWAADDTENIFKYRPHVDGVEWNQWDPKKDPRTGFAKLPEATGEWRYVLGMDMGHSDPFALQVFAYNRHERILWHVFEHEEKGMRPQTIAKLLIGEDLDPRNPQGVIGVTGWPDDMVADTSHLGGMILDELRQVYGIHCEQAERKHKFDAIELFNGDLLDGLIKVMKGSKLEQQLMSLQWTSDEWGGLKETKGQPNHSTDAAVYARRRAMHRFTEEAPAPQPKRGTPEALEAVMLAEEERAAGQADRGRWDYDDSNFWGD